jgi:endonuclease YncB( thermonuclease family)
MVLLLVVLGAATGAPAAELVGQVTRVSDGDTLRLRVGRREVKIRLHGIDAPEAQQICRGAKGECYACGREAQTALQRMVEGHAVRCRPTGGSSYKRKVATCFAGGINLNQAMVERGWAFAYRRYSTAYVKAEEAAKRAQRGLWSGAFVTPESWRHRAERLPGCE